MNYRVRVLRVGQVDVPASEVYWMSQFDQWTTLQFQIAVIQGEGKIILLNTGFPDDITGLAEAWREFLGDRAVLQRPEDWKPAAALPKIGIALETVDYVLISPIQIYTTGNLRLFSRAQFVFSRKGWIEDLIAPTYPHHVPRAGCIRDDDFFWLLGAGQSRLLLLGDTHELLPGLTCRWVGVHHRSSFAVEVQTARGKVVLSDCAFHYGNLERNHPLGIAESIIEAHAAYDYLRREADIFVPLYDPEVWVRHPEGIIA